MKRISAATNVVPFELDGVARQGVEGEPLAAALLACGETVFSRSVKYHRPRGPFCFAAACTQCLMRVDGAPNIYTCQVPLKAGMKVERQNAYPSAKHDIFAAIDLTFPRGLDHHEMFAGVPVAHDVMAKVARQLAGLGVLPAGPAPERAPAEKIHAPVVIIGEGHAGRAAARTLMANGVEPLVIERNHAPTVGRTFPRAQAIGFYDSADGIFVLAVTLDAPNRAFMVSAGRFLLAGGGHPSLLAFANNDLPGVYAGRALMRLATQHGVLPGPRVALVGSPAELAHVGHALREAGAEVVLSLDTTDAHAASNRAGVVRAPLESLKALGLRRVQGLRYTPEGERKAKKVQCDVIGVCAPPSPAFELARQAGARISFRPKHGVFAVDAGANGRTARAEVFAAGELTSVMAPSAAAAMGERVAETLVSELRSEVRQ